MIILFQNILLFQNNLSYYLTLKSNFLPAMAVLGYLTKLKSGLELASGAHFLYIGFSNKNVPYLIPYQWTKFQCHNFFPSQDIKQNVLSSHLDSR